MRPRPTKKVLPRSRALALRRRWGREGLKVVFTNGVFDLLHAGHADLLEKAARLGERLVVGVNTDELYPPAEEFIPVAMGIPGAKLFAYDSILGHMANGLEIDKATAVMKAFIDETE